MQRGIFVSSRRVIQMVKGEAARPARLFIWRKNVKIVTSSDALFTEIANESSSRISFFFARDYNGKKVISIKVCIFFFFFVSKIILRNQPHCTKDQLRLREKNFFFSIAKNATIQANTRTRRGKVELSSGWWTKAQKCSTRCKTLTALTAHLINVHIHAVKFVNSDNYRSPLRSLCYIETIFAIRNASRGLYPKHKQKGKRVFFPVVRNLHSWTHFSSLRTLSLSRLLTLCRLLKTHNTEKRKKKVWYSPYTNIPLREKGMNFIPILFFLRYNRRVDSAFSLCSPRKCEHKI